MQDTEATEATATADLAAMETLTTGEVADLFGVNSNTIIRWAKAGRLNVYRKLGGRNRYFSRDEIAQKLAEARRPTSP